MQKVEEGGKEKKKKGKEEGLSRRLERSSIKGHRTSPRLYAAIFGKRKREVRKKGRGEKKKPSVASENFAHKRVDDVWNGRSCDCPFIDAGRGEKKKKKGKEGKTFP